MTNSPSRWSKHKTKDFTPKGLTTVKSKLNLKKENLNQHKKGKTVN